MDKDRTFNQKRPKAMFYRALKEKKYKLVRMSPHGDQCWTEINEAGDTGAAWLRGNGVIWLVITFASLNLLHPPTLKPGNIAVRFDGSISKDMYLKHCCSIMIFAD